MGLCVLIMQNCLIELTMKLMKLPDLFGYIEMVVATNKRDENDPIRNQK